MPKDHKKQELISHQYKNMILHQRKSDGYINATEMCKGCGKDFFSYERLDSTKEYIKVLEAKPLYHGLSLINKLRGGKNSGTFVHPKIAIHLAQWLSPEFADFVTDLVLNWMTIAQTTTYQKPEPTAEYLKIRNEGKAVRKELTDFLIKECGKTAVHAMNITNQIYRGLFGMDSVQIRKTRALPEKCVVREHLGNDELFWVKTMEEKAIDLLRQEKERGDTISSGAVGRTIKTLASMFKDFLATLKSATTLSMLNYQSHQ